MKILWCWRCQMDIPMLDEEEYAKTYAIYRECMRNREEGVTMENRYQKVLTMK